MLILLQGTTGPGGPTQPQASPLSGAQVGIAAMVIAVIALVVFLLIRSGVGQRTLAEGQRSWLDYGNFYVVTLGIAAVTIGFIVVLQFLDRFEDGTQALGFLTALFGVIAGLVGTYFGIKASSDARSGAENLAREAGGTTPPTITIEPPTANRNVNEIHTVTATVTSADGSAAAGVPVTFTITAGPDMGTIESQNIENDPSGRATFEFTNNGEAGRDTIEAAALGAKGMARVDFTQ